MDEKHENDSSAREYVRIRRDQRGCVLEVCTIRWKSPAEPIARWKVVRRWPSAPPSDELDAATSDLLKDPRYFLLCTICRIQVPRGHMHSDEVCQGCAEKHLGVVH